MKEQNKKVQDDPDKALREFADKLAKIIADAIHSADILVIPGLIQVTGLAGPSTNTVPIFISKPIK